MSGNDPRVYEATFLRTPLQLLCGEGWKKLVALRVDSEGVLLGGAPARYKKQTAFAPWEDIRSMVLWYQRTAGQGINHIGLRRRPGAPQLAGPNSRMSPRSAALVAPHVEYDLLLDSRPISLWRLDPERLQAAVDAFAPHVRVLVYQQTDQ
ncbi:hypothetical protein [Streptomyces sp. NRRL S-1521]|uniref:hypothetical protein n=1 Tax=Streptomyces sp. NRRL S-1521 TaxID=1609100 RepID=UPI000749C0BC|nr:hypothetical protein [Streptomyces sp. NRRL S-1521]KUL63835.1 hypothetical protein ADL30_02340 [Streptomyces sp. NRRL S-1521]